MITDYLPIENLNFLPTFYYLIVNNNNFKSGVLAEMFYFYGRFNVFGVKNEDFVLGLRMKMINFIDYRCGAPYGYYVTVANGSPYNQLDKFRTTLESQIRCEFVKVLDHQRLVFSFPLFSQLTFFKGISMSKFWNNINWN